MKQRIVVENGYKDRRKELETYRGEHEPGRLLHEVAVVHDEDFTVRVLLDIELDPVRSLFDRALERCHGVVRRRPDARLYPSGRVPCW